MRSGDHLPPGPEGCTDAETFVTRLVLLRRWAGQPSLRRLRAVAGKTTTAGGAVVDALPQATVSNVLNLRRNSALPRFAFVNSFVRACLTVAGMTAEEVEGEVRRWQRVWRCLGNGAAARPSSRAPGRGRPETPGGAADRSAAARGPSGISGADGPTPAQLPADTADFTGRARELADLVAAVDSAESPTLLIVGTGGVGKTTLAVHLGHRLRGRHPDGQFYVDLGGVQRTPERPGDVLAAFLRALGAGERIPASEAERSALFRSAVASRRILVILDNARDAVQVRPLLPAGAGCTTIITGRDPLATLPVTRRIRLGAFEEDEAIAFLGRIADGTDTTATAEVARLCGRLPLALRIAGARAESLMGGSLSALAGRLADHRRRLEELELDDLSVGSSFELSYRLLAGKGGAARAFRLLGLLEGPDTTLPGVVALLGEPVASAEAAVAELVRAQLLEPYRPHRYRMHDLVRQYAARRAAATDSAGDLDRARLRLLDWLLDAAAEAVAVTTKEAVMPRFDGPAAVHRWFHEERANLLGAARAGLRSPACERRAVELIQAMTFLFRCHGYDEEWERLNETALAAARRSRLMSAAGSISDELSKLREDDGDPEAARRYAEESLAFRRRTGDLAQEARGLINLGAGRHEDGRVEEARGHYGRALELAGLAGDRLAEGYALANLAAVSRDLGRPDDAITFGRRALGIVRELGDCPGQIDVLGDLAASYRAGGRTDDALRMHGEVLELARGMGDLPRVATALCDLGQTLLEAGDLPRAADAAAEALTMFRQVSHSRGRELASSLLERIRRATSPSAGVGS
ncbi:hypothetical protein GCM10010156_09940 [Planobispora rosea]|uniref:AAA+ ATPase domain-containing protein n=1 Tax=Planobispora rosea TaxID=35762 RepID=A0A8J3WAY7_PLARO|nr:tetratricopeptide repeat protein [Planobispora rosea]GGS53306.1 hypothetical protein GCM10010156_09940 [Planobispora rosea]GIH82595.1 hypothetical protein Pro02_10030 [Planobispora rosea]